MRGPAFFVVAAILASGCASAPPTPEATGPTDPQPEAPRAPEFTDDTGALVVKVHSDELEPIAGAEVGLTGADTGAMLAAASSPALGAVLAPEERALTNEIGEAYFDNVEPASYLLFVNAANHSSAGRKVDVKAGEATTVILSLKRLASRDPYSELTQHKGSWKCQVGTGVTGIADVCSAYQDCNANSCFRSKADENWTALVLEVVAPPQSTFSARSLKVTFNGNLTGRGNWVALACPKGPSPLRFETEANQTIDSSNRCTGTTHERFPPGALGIAPQVNPWAGPNPMDSYVALEQKWTAYLTVFYHQKVPTGYTAQPDT